jgi:TonB family protein
MAKGEANRVKEKFEEELGSLRGCLVDGDVQERLVQRRVRRRALVMSVALQSVALTLILLAPLFGKTERLAVKDWVPMPPYSPIRQHAGEAPKQRGAGPQPPTTYTFNRPYVPISQLPPSQTIIEDEFSNLPEGPGGEKNVCSWCGIPGGTGKGPDAPTGDPEIHERRTILRFRNIDPAMLTNRVEPIYPILAIQTHMSGRVELKAIIATDGSIRSLEVVTGNPIFLQSAKNAVTQWRYKPTYLNGQAVEVETFITVIYSSQR